jgi:phosphatidylinositol alpha-mannosyltransferase
VRVALLHPTYWPEVRRGSERLVHDLASGLARRGIDATVLTTAPGRGSVEREDGFTVVRGRRVPAWPVGRRRWEEHLAVVPAQLAGVLRGRFDVAHAFYPVDAWAAVRARRLGGPPVIFSFHGIVNRQWLVKRRCRLRMALTAARDAAACTVLSEAATEPFRSCLRRAPEVLPGGVATDAFARDEPRAPAPTVVCAASLSDPRKRGPILFEAFERLRHTRADARLVLAGPADGGDPASLPDGVARVAADATPDLARAYATAWTSVLPAVDEAFGLVIVESLSAGTPVVAARSGAAPSLVANGEVGRLFEPDDPVDLTRAMDEALDLAAKPSTVAACRARAAAYDWDVVLPRYEALYRRLVPT